MLKMTVPFVAALILLVGCSPAAENLSIDVAKKAGFERDQQQMFQMVGAKDGWSGKWAGDRVELYEFSDPESVNEEAFEASVKPGNISGWVEMCVTRNMLLLSKGESACRELEDLAK